MEHDGEVIVGLHLLRIGDYFAVVHNKTIAALEDIHGISRVDALLQEVQAAALTRYVCGGTMTDCALMGIEHVSLHKELMAGSRVDALLIALQTGEKMCFLHGESRKEVVF